MVVQRGRMHEFGDLKRVQWLESAFYLPGFGKKHLALTCKGELGAGHGGPLWGALSRPSREIMGLPWGPLPFRVLPDKYRSPVDVLWGETTALLRCGVHPDPDS